MIIGGSVYYELLRDNYRPRGGKWVEMSKEEAKVYDNNPDIKKIFVDDQDHDLDDSSSSEYVISINTNMKMMNMRFSISRSEIHYLFPIHTFSLSTFKNLCHLYINGYSSRRIYYQSREWPKDQDWHSNLETIGRQVLYDRW